VNAGCTKVLKGTAEGEIQPLGLGHCTLLSEAAPSSALTLAVLSLKTTKRQTSAGAELEMMHIDVAPLSFCCRSA